MLFSRVYNWIKYKTLPPSVLFLNRLFVERDSKHRRILSNLGLTFRNSKWSTYARTNVQDGGNAHLYTFLLLSLSFIGIALTFYYTLSYYSFAKVVNDVLIPIWFLSDIELYTSSFYVFISWITLGQITTITQRFTWLPSVTSKMNTIKYKSKGHMDDSYIPKRFYKSIVYKWSTLSTCSMLNVFEGTPQSIRPFYQSFYKNLYNLVKVFTQDRNTVLSYKSALRSCTHDSNLNLYETLTLSKLISPVCISTYNTLVCDYKIRNTAGNFTTDTYEFHSWTLDQLWNERLSRPLSSSVQPFYLSQMTYNTINQLLVLNIEFIAFLNSLESQSNLRSTHKWMYKYNLLHRASLRDPFQLTLFLKHLAPSFYISTFFSRNMWTSSTLNHNVSRHLTLGSYNEALSSYHSLYLNDNILRRHSLFRNLNNFSQLTLFTTSYNWVLQRFYLFNTLPTHIMRWNTNYRDYANLNPQKYTYASCNWNSHFQWHLSNQRWSYVSPLSASVNALDSSLISINSKTSSTLYLNYWEYTLFSKLNTELALNLITNQGAPTLTFYSLQPLN